MKLVPVDKNIMNGWYATTGNKTIIDEFIESGMQCAEVEGYTQKTAASCVNSLKQTIKRYRVFNVKVMSRQNRVFLIRDEI